MLVQLCSHVILVYLWLSAFNYGEFNLARHWCLYYIGHFFPIPPNQLAVEWAIHFYWLLNCQSHFNNLCKRHWEITIHKKTIPKRTCSQSSISCYVIITLMATVISISRSKHFHQPNITLFLQTCQSWNGLRPDINLFCRCWYVSPV